ncbi:unnamed protein product [Knipowitschia caucasica]
MLTLPLEPGPQSGLMDSYVSSSFGSFVSERRRSPRKNHITERRARQRPAPSSCQSQPQRPAPSSCQSQPPSPAHLPVFTAGAYGTVQSRLEPPEEESPAMEELSFSIASNQSVPNQLQRPQISSLNQNAAPTDRSAAPTDPDETCRSWVIGPLFQSFKSKMASFTEIVMSPAKLFKASSSDSVPLVQTSPSESADMDPDISTVQSSSSESAENMDPDKSVLKLDSEVKSVLRDNVRLVPWETKPEATVDQCALETTASCQTTANFSTTASCQPFSEEKQTNRSSKTRSRPTKVTDCEAMICEGPLTEIDPESVVALEDRIAASLKDRTPASILDNAKLRKVKRTLNLSEETIKRKKSAAKVEVEPATKKKPKHKSEKADAKAATNWIKMDSVEREFPMLKNEVNGEILDKLRSSDDNKSLQVKARAVKPARFCLEPSADVKKGKKRKTRDETKAEVVWDQNSEGHVKKTKAAPKHSMTAPGGRAKKGNNATETSFETTPQENCDSTDDCDMLTEDPGWTRLLRSHSCPEIPALRLDSSWTPHFHSPPRSRSQPPQQHILPLSLPPPQQHSLLLSLPSSLPHNFQRSNRRERRHTVCSLEVEREVAPLCLRKEVFPTRRSPSLYEARSPMRALSPGASLSALASGFLCSPLAFLSTRSEGKSSVQQGSLCPHITLTSPVSHSRAHNSPHPLHSPTYHSASPSYHSLAPSLPHSSPTASASPSSCPSLVSLLGTSLGQLPGLHLRTDNLKTSDLSLRPGPCPSETPAAEDEDDTSSSPESEELREETTQSDSETKVQKADGQRKVSSIKIRRALPKPQNNLTPMGLPKTVRVKKKEFSLEEIYTNKNYSKAPESRLETIFESPLSRKTGAAAWCGQKRLKRFVEFPELGEARRPKRPPGGGAKLTGGGVKANRKRRGTKEEPASCDPDSLLCAKLDQLTTWLHQHEHDPLLT